METYKIPWFQTTNQIHHFISRHWQGWTADFWWTGAFLKWGNTTESSNVISISWQWLIFNRRRRVLPATMERAIYPVGCKQPLHRPSKNMVFVCFCIWCLWITQFLCKTALCVKDCLDAKTLVLFKPRFKFKPKHVCKPGFWKRPYWKRLWKRVYLESLCV